MSGVKGSLNFDHYALLKSGTNEISFVNGAHVEQTGGGIVLGSAAAVGNPERKEGSVCGICGNGGILTGNLGTGRITHQKNPGRVQMIAFCILGDPVQNSGGVLQRCGKAPARGQTIVEI